MTARAISIAVMLAAGAPPSAWADEPVLRGRCPDGRTWTANADDAARMLAALNRVRREAKRAPLTPLAPLDRLAQAHSADMACRNYFDHTTPERRRLKDKVARSAPDAPAWERIAEVIGTSDSADRQVERWLTSRSHRQAVLNRDHQRVGIGVARMAAGSRYRTYWTVELLQERDPRR